MSDLVSFFKNPYTILLWFVHALLFPIFVGGYDNNNCGRFKKAQRICIVFSQKFCRLLSLHYIPRIFFHVQVRTCIATHTYVVSGLVLQATYSYSSYHIAQTAVCIAASGSNKTTRKKIVEAAAKGCAQVMEVRYADTARSHGVFFSEQTKMMRFAGGTTTYVCTCCPYLLFVHNELFPAVMLVLFLQLRVFASYIRACTPGFSMFMLPNLELLVWVMKWHDVPFSHSTFFIPHCCAVIVARTFLVPF
jgi:hypothetical protein